MKTLGTLCLRFVFVFTLTTFLIIGLLSRPILALSSPTPVSIDDKVKVTLTKKSTSGTTDVYVATLTNVSQHVINAPVSLVITGISTSTVTLVDPSGYTATGQPYRTVSLVNNVLNPGQSASVELKFNKKKAVSYTFTYSVFGVPSNYPPVANAGPDQTVNVNATVILNGSGSTDQDGDPLTYRWAFVSKPTGSAATLSSPTAVKPTFVADKHGDYTISLVVNDGMADSAPDTVTISTLNSPPVANAGPDQTAPVGTTVTLDGSHSSDVDGDPLTYRWTLTSQPLGSTAALSGPTAVNPKLTLDKPGQYVVQLIVNDGIIDSAPDTVQINTVNSPPVANAGPNQTVFVGTTVTLDGSGSTDVDGDTLTYRWSLTSVPAGSVAALSNPTLVNPTFTVDKPGIYVAQLIVNDGHVDSAPATVTISTQNSPPVANAGPNQTVFVGTLVTLDGSGSTDVDGDPLTYHWSLVTVPAGSTAALSSLTAVKPTFTVDRPGSYIAQLIVNDGHVDSTAATVTITTQNSPPVANAGPNQSVFVGTLVTLDGSGSTDVDGDPLTYQWSLLSVPAGSLAALQNPASVKPTFTVDRPGSYVAQLIVNDGHVDSAPATVTITTQNSRPVADAGADQTAVVGQTVTLDGTGSHDADNDPLTFAWSLLSQPANSTATLTAANQAKATFVPDLAGIYVAQLIVSDGQLDSLPATTTVTVTVPVVNQNPQITSTPVTTGQVGVAYRYQVQATDPDGDPLSYALTTAPTGMTISAAGLITWTPNAQGAFSVALSVTDGRGGSTSQSYIVTVSLASVTVPNVVGFSQSAAGAAIIAANLTVGTVTQATSSTVPAGNVVSQDPPPPGPRWRAQVRLTW